MAKTYNNIAVQLIPAEPAEVRREIAEASLFLRHAFRLNLGLVIGEAAPHMRPGPDIRPLWEDIPPSDDGSYVFELATALPAYLPSLRGESDYRIVVDGRTLIVSLRMVQCFLPPQSSSSDGLDYAIVHREGLPSLVKSPLVNGMDVHPLPLRTFIATQFRVNAPTAQDAVRKHMYEWRDVLTNCIAKLLEAIRIVDPNAAKLHLPHLSVSMFPVFWLAVEGKNEDSKAAAQFAGDLGLAAFRSLAQFDEPKTEQLERALREQETAASEEIALSLAHVFAHQGNHAFALVQTCIACEAVLSRKYRAYLLSRGVSNNKIKDAWRDTATFSQMLNIHLRSMSDLADLPDADQILLLVDAARKHRNDVVHEGQLKGQVTPESVKETIAAAEKLVDYVNALPFEEDGGGGDE